jgi:hypothetical protein
MRLWSRIPETIRNTTGSSVGESATAVSIVGIRMRYLKLNWRYKLKDEALKLADELDALHQYVPSEAPAMIRRLVAENEFLKDWRDTWSPYVNQLKEGKE